MTAGADVDGGRRAAAFVDKDGTLVRNVPYNVDAERVEFTSGALSGLARLADAGYLLIVVSNQPGIALGRFSPAALDAHFHDLKERLADAGIAIAAFYACPHAPAAGHGTLPPCGCRKPAPGLLQRAAREHGIDLASSWMIGDILDDVEAGRRAGCRTVLLDAGNETEWRFSKLRTPTVRAPDLDHAARSILRHARDLRPLPAAVGAPA